MESARDHAPIDAIGGFSQGALIAAAVAASGRVPSVKLLLTVCGMPWQWLHVSVRAALPLVVLPSCHVISEDDPTLSRELIHSLASRCDQPIVITQQHGHALPQMNAPLSARITAFLSAAAKTVPPSVENAATATPQAAAGGGLSHGAHEQSDGFLWRQIVERQRRWYEVDSTSGKLRRDRQQRFVPSAANPLPQLSPQDKIMQRVFLDQLEVPQPRLLATIQAPEEILQLTLPPSWILKPIGAAYSEGLICCRDGIETTFGLPCVMWGVVAQLRELQARQARHAASASTSESGVEMHYNCAAFLIEELVQDDHGPRPVDYRIFVSGDTVLWVEMSVQDTARATCMQAAVNEHYVLYPPAFDANEVAWPLCTSAEELPPRPGCWDEMLHRARQLGLALGVFARLDWYADRLRGPLLGEITLTPNMGQSPALYRPWVNAIVRSTWQGADGAPPVTRPEAVRTLEDVLSGCTHGVISPWASADILAAVAAFDLSAWAIPHGSRVGIAVPTGPLAALCLLAVMHSHCAVPLDPFAPSSATASAAQRLRVCCLLAPSGRGAIATRAAAAAAAANIPLVPVGGDGHTAEPLAMSPRELLPTSSDALQALPTARRTLQDTVLVLSTSGTTGKAKSVPFTLSRVLASGGALAASMHLTSGDVGLNMGLPLHHVGGIACNLVAPLVSRGRMRFEAAFSAEAWLEATAMRVPPCFDTPAVTWCYQVATMWHRIVQRCADDTLAPPHHLRVLRSGASPLPHADAARMAALFGACVLPTYSMTECMPIASPPLGYGLEHPESVGVPVGSVKLRLVRSAADDESAALVRDVPIGEVGEVALVKMGNNLLFDGYDGEPPITEAFPTGDLGRLDANGRLTLTGRVREMINRGGEVLAPISLEETLRRHPRLGGAELMVFAASHAELQEVVGLAITPTCELITSGAVSSALQDVRVWAREHMSIHAIPIVLVVASVLPRTATGKLQRVGFGSRVGLPLLRGTAARSFVLDEDPHENTSALRLHEHTALPATTSATTIVAEARGLSGEGIGTVGGHATRAHTVESPTRATPRVEPPSIITPAPLTAAAVMALLSAHAAPGGELLTMDTPLLDTAFDSLAAVDIALRLRTLTRHPVPLTLLWECASARSVIELICDVDAVGASDSVAPPSAVASTRAPSAMAPTMWRGGRPTCMFLHGMASSAALMEILLRGAGWTVELEDDVTFVCVDAMHAAPAVPELYAALVEAGLYGVDTPCFDYGLRRDDAGDEAARVHASVSHADALLVRHTPAMIGGICDGGLLAALLASRHADSLRLLLNVCGSAWETLPTPLRTSAAIVEVPSLHLLGLRDELLTQDELESLSRRCSDATILRHPQGHAMPVLSRRLSARLAHAIREACGVGGAADSAGWWEDDDDGAVDRTPSDSTVLPDSIQMLLDAGVRVSQCIVTEHVYGACLLFVVVAHWHELFHTNLTSSSALAGANCLTNGSCHVLTSILTVGRFFTLQAFLVVAGTTDARLPPLLMRRLAANTTLVVVPFLWLMFMSDVPERLSAIIEPPPHNTTVLAGFHRELVWFGFLLLFCRLLHAALTVMRVRPLLPLIGIVTHFGCYSGHCLWPLRRAPFDLRLLPPSDPMHLLALVLPKTGSFATLLIYYATVPALLPSEFPRAYPDPFALLIKCTVPRGARRKRLLTRTPSMARAAWALVLLFVVLGCLVPSFRGRLHYYDSLAHHASYGCARGDCNDQVWAFGAMMDDASGVLLSIVVVIGVAAAAPRCTTPISWAGARSWQVYVLHDYLMPQIGPYLFGAVIWVGRALHDELAAVAVFVCAALVVTVLAAVPLEHLPPFLGPWIDMCTSAARHTDTNERAPLVTSPDTKAGGDGKGRSEAAHVGSTHGGWWNICALLPLPLRRICALLPLPILLGVVHALGGMRVGGQMQAIAHLAVGGEPHHACARVRVGLPPGVLEGTTCAARVSVWLERPCAAVRACADYVPPTRKSPLVDGANEVKLRPSNGHLGTGQAPPRADETPRIQRAERSSRFPASAPLGEVNAPKTPALHVPYDPMGVAHAFLECRRHNHTVAECHSRQQTHLLLRPLRGYHGAVCNDGSPAGYYYQRPQARRSRLWLVYLEGGGLCFDGPSCASRCAEPTSPLCRYAEEDSNSRQHTHALLLSTRLCPACRSSRAWERSIPSSGLLHADPPSELATANKIFVRYCSSDAFVGDSAVFGRQFRGEKIIKALVADLVEFLGLGRTGAESETVVLAGSSSGAYGAMAHLDYVLPMLEPVLGPAAGAIVRVVGFLDSPLQVAMPALPTVDPSRVLAFGDRERRMAASFNVGHLGDACTATVEHHERWKCLLALYRLPHVRTPFLLASSTFDSVQLGRLLGTAPGTPPRVDNGEMAYALAFARNLTRSAREVQAKGAASNVLVSLFLASCFDHAPAGTTQIFNVRRAGGETMHGALVNLLQRLPHQPGGTSSSASAVSLASQLTFIDPCEGFACGRGRCM